MENKLSVSKLKIVFATLFLLCFLCSCNENNQKIKRAFVVSKTDDDNWTTSAIIECDSVDMINVKHAKYWIDGRGFNLYAKSYIKIQSNP